MDERRTITCDFGARCGDPDGDHWSGNSADRKALRMAEAAARETLAG